MKSRATPKFWRLFDDLPDDVQEQARDAYALWRSNPGHPSLRFKRVSRKAPVYSVRIGLGYRAENDRIIRSTSDLDRAIRCPGRSVRADASCSLSISSKRNNVLKNIGSAGRIRTYDQPVNSRF